MKSLRARNFLGLSFVAFALGPQVAQAQDLNKAQPSRIWLEGGVSASNLWLPDVRFNKRNQNAAGVPFVASITDHDGDMGLGPRLDVSVRTLTGVTGGHAFVLGLSGFYAWFREDQDRLDQCDPLCGFTGIVDTGAFALATGFPVRMRTERDVHHYGVSLDVLLPRTSIGGLKDPTRVVSERWVPRFGVAYKAIDQEMHVRDQIVVTGQALAYDEDLDTDYFGIFGGLSGNHKLTSSLVLTVGGEAGIYYATTKYSGTLTENLGGAVVGGLNGSLKLDEDKEAFIGKLRVAATQMFAGFSLSGFVEGEYYSYVPRIRYNDLAGNGAQVTGPDSGTSIVDDKAYALNGGVKVIVPLN